MPAAPATQARGGAVRGGGGGQGGGGEGQRGDVPALSVPVDDLAGEVRPQVRSGGHAPGPVRGAARPLFALDGRGVGEALPLPARAVEDGEPTVAVHRPLREPELTGLARRQGEGGLPVAPLPLV